MAVDNTRAELCRYFVELIGKMCHLVCAILVTSKHLIDWVDDDCDVILLQSPADKLRRQLVHRYGLSTQIPDIDVLDVFWWQFHSLIDITEAMQGRRTV